MSQISLYMDDAVMNTVRSEAALQGVSLSRFIGSLVKNYADSRSTYWPTDYWENAYGCISDAEAETLHAAISESCLDGAKDDACDWFGEA